MKSLLQDPAAWSQISPFVDEVLDVPAHDRERWLGEFAKKRPQIAGALRQLIQEFDALENRQFLSGTSVEADVQSELERMFRERDDMSRADAQATSKISQGNAASGKVLGPYRLVREIGQGGMSAVWLAERIDGSLKREVALKLPYAGPGRLRLADRFKRECEILSVLTHPNIARVFDAGVDDGQPYLAMEFVEGASLIRYCDEHRLTLRERLSIFLQAAGAVEFAHEQLILHRDLKPSNMLVTHQGRVVLLDFGIAKVLSEQETGETLLTEVGGRMLTPDYAAPEHLGGRPLSTSSDVYSLGVVLYELLTGTRPFGAPGGSRRALEEAILTQEPPRPSSIPIASEIADARATTPRKLSQSLKGDLDTILLKALKKSPAERYRSADAFAEDIANYLNGMPVKAQPDSAWYRATRFAARHSLPLSAATITLLAILSAAVVSLWQARTAARERDRAYVLASRNEAINDFTGTLIADAAASEKPITVSEMLAQSEKLALADVDSSPENRAAVLGMIAERYYAIGNTGKSAELLDAALPLIANSRDQELRSRLMCRHALSFGSKGKLEESIHALDAVIATLKPGSESAAECLLDRSYLANRAGDGEGVLRYATTALTRFGEAAQFSVGIEGSILGAIADGYEQTGDVVKANRYYELALQKFVQTGRENSSDAMALRSNWAGIGLTAGMPMQSLKMYEETLDILKRRDPNALPPAAVVHNRARSLELIGRYSAAAETYALCERIGLQQGSQLVRAYCLFGRANVAEVNNDRAAVAKFLSDALEPLGNSLSPDSSLLVRLAGFRGRAALAEGRFDEARKQFDRALAKKPRNVVTIQNEVDVVKLDLARGDANSALVAATAAFELASSLQGGVPYSNYTGLAALARGRALLGRGDTAEARKYFETAVTHLSNTVDADHPALVQARKLLSAAN